MTTPLDFTNMTTAAFDALNDPLTKLTAWNAVSVELDRLKLLETHMRKAAVSIYFPTGSEGTQNYDLGNGYKLKVVKKLNYKFAGNELVDKALDAIAKLGNDGEGKFIAERLVKFDPRLSATEYKALDPKIPAHKKIKDAIDAVLTITEGTPSLEVVAPKAGA
jgi:hypothetical protein